MGLRIYQAGVYTVANDATPLGDTVVTPENKLPVVDKAQLEHILGRQHYIRSIDPAVFDSDRVVPVVVSCSGMGLMELGFNAKLEDGKIHVVALAIDEDAQAVRAHRANHPQVPVVQARITHIDQFKAIVRAYLPEEHWGKAWFHSSNSCKPAATVNRRRDLAAAIEDTEFFISCMQSCEPAP